MTARVRVFLPLLVGLLLLAGVATGLRQASESLVVRPGPARPVAPMLTVAGQRPATTGDFYLTSVSLDPNVTLVEWLTARLGLEGELESIERLRPHGISSERYGEISRHLLDESTEVAKIVALRRAGHPVEVRNRGASITAVQPGRPADGAVQPRDLITAVDGAPVTTAAEAGSAIRGRAVGAPVRLTIERDGASSEVTLTTNESSLTPGQATVGISVGTDTVVTGQPFEIGIDAGNLGGPSAGLMFTLTILDALSDDDLTHGQRIAGTGTISLDETVGPIDGVKHKVKGAERAGARYFLAPQENAAEARAAATSLTVVEIGALRQALDFLATLPAAETGPTPLPAAAPALAPAA